MRLDFSASPKAVEHQLLHVVGVELKVLVVVFLSSRDILIVRAVIPTVGCRLDVELVVVGSAAQLWGLGTRRVAEDLVVVGSAVVFLLLVAVFLEWVLAVGSTEEPCRALGQSHRHHLRFGRAMGRTK